MSSSVARVERSNPLLDYNDYRVSLSQMDAPPRLLLRIHRQFVTSQRDDQCDPLGYFC